MNTRGVIPSDLRLPANERRRIHRRAVTLLVSDPASLQRAGLRFLWPFLFILIYGIGFALAVEHGLVPGSRMFHPFVWDLILSLGGLSGFLLLTVWMVRRTRRREYHRCLNRALAEAGYPYCHSCGYSLKGSKAPVTRCPECGATRESMPEVER